jgi:hypothetical protein
MPRNNPHGKINRNAILSQGEKKFHVVKLGTRVRCINRCDACHPLMRNILQSNDRIHEQPRAWAPYRQDIAKFTAIPAEKNRSRPGNANPGRKFYARITHPEQELLMRSKLAISALMIVSLFGATAIASAQTQPAAGASSEGNAGPGAPNMKSGNMKSGKMKTSKAKSGSTTGMSSGSKKGSAAPAADDGEK